MKAYITKQDDYWGDDADVTHDDAFAAITRLLCRCGNFWR